MMQSLLADIRHAWKALVRDPGPSFMVVLLLALGIAATVSVYSITAGVVLRPLPYETPESLVQIRQVDPVEGYEYGTSGPTFRDLRAATTSLSALAVASPGEMILDDGGPASRVAVASVSGDFFRVPGVPPALGRVLLPSDAGTGGPRVVVLSDALWRERFGGSPDALGRVVRLNGEPYEVVGVAGPDLDLPRGTDAWIPIPPDAPVMEVRGAHILPTFGRLADDATAATAEAEMNAIIQGIPDERFEARVVPMKEQLVGDFRTPLLILLGAVAFVLLIAAANAGTLLLARTARRRRELAIRDALGAGSRRVATQLLAESMILAIAAGGAGILASAWILDGLVALAPADLPRAGELGLDAGVMAFAVVVSLLTGLLTGAIPALRAARRAPVVDLKTNDIRAGGTGRIQRVFVVAEVALSVVLLVGAGLLGRSFYEIISTDPGFDAERVTTFEISLPGFRYPEVARLRSYHERLLDRVRALPEVADASLAQNLPVGGSYMVTPALVEGRELDDPPRVQVSAVAPGYFETLGLDLVSGRTFDDRDVADAPPVAMVDEAFARLYFDGDDPVGRRARTYFDSAMREIVGVVSPTVHASLTDAPEPRFYYPAAQLPPRSARLLVRSETAPPAVIAAVRRAFEAVDPEVPPGDIATMSQLLARTTAEPRFYAMTLATFAALALVLAVAGFFAVLSQSVTARRREMGVRIAIGAEPGGVLRMVIRQGMTLTAIGLVLGVAGGLAAARLLRGLLYDVGPADPLVLTAVAALLALVALAAAWVPARRAARTDPMETLRVE
ncbi:MAG: ABC transporter permease [Candidatus Longimicrobiales bacterium M2_2A_002]